MIYHDLLGAGPIATAPALLLAGYILDSAGSARLYLTAWERDCSLARVLAYIAGYKGWDIIGNRSIRFSTDTDMHLSTVLLFTNSSTATPPTLGIPK